MASILCCNINALYIPVYGHYIMTKEYENLGEVYASVTRLGQTNYMDYDIYVNSDIYSQGDLSYSCTASILVESTDSTIHYEKVLDVDFYSAGEDYYFFFNPECNTHIHIFLSIVYNESEYCYCTYDYYWGYDSTLGKMGFTSMNYYVDEYEG